MTEIERKFLLSSDAWRAQATSCVHITDGLVLTDGQAKLRVRIAGAAAFLTFKGPRQGIARDEFEYAIPVDDAHAMMKRYCAGRILSKTRHFVPKGALIWVVDTYDPPLDGVILAEVEVPHVDYPLSLPDWIGAEVTGLPQYRKMVMHQQRTGQPAVTLA